MDDGEEGVGVVVVPAKHWWLPQPEKLGGQHGGGDAYQELAGGKVGVGVEVEGVGDREDSICSLAVDLLPLVEKVRVALTPATSNSS